MPFAQILPAQAIAINVVNGSLTNNIDFALSTYSWSDLPVNVEDSDQDVLPNVFQLGQSYPNPVHHSDLSNGVIIDFQLPEVNVVSISIFNILGQKVATILDNEVPAGFHKVQWSGKDDYGNLLPTGIYFYSLKSETGIKQMKKLVVLR